MLTKLQTILIVVGSAVGLQVASALVDISPDDLAEPGTWLKGLLIGVLNAIGVSIIALKTTGGLTLPKSGG